MKNRIHILAASFLILFISCREVYKPAILSSSKTYIVVEGVLNVNGPTSITLSRTTALESTAFDGELNAQVSVEGKDNISRPLSAAGNGIYSSLNLGLTLNNEYRLRIRTSSGKEYLSDYVTARTTPAIDSITWRQEDRGLQLFVNTHDASNNTRYYRWDYAETWEVWSYYTAGWIYIKDSNRVRRILPQEDASVGWKYDSSKTILLGSSASLASDIIFRLPVNFIEAGSEKLGVRYSILVKQYALDKAGYAFYELMKKNTESIGTIFDPQPSEVKGNIHCISNPGELVIGYISASTVAEKRIFIANQDLVSWRYQQDCPIKEIINDPDSIRLAFQGGLMPWDVKYSVSRPGEVGFYMSSFGRCVDVTRKGASLIKPSYW